MALMAADTQPTCYFSQQIDIDKRDFSVHSRGTQVPKAAMSQTKAFTMLLYHLEGRSRRRSRAKTVITCLIS
jgi:hypothetical protein